MCRNSQAIPDSVDLRLKNGELYVNRAFQSAINYVPKMIGVADGIKLQFYAFFKQATIGKCSTEKPSYFDFVGKAKWAGMTFLVE